MFTSPQTVVRLLLISAAMSVGGPMIAQGAGGSFREVHQLSGSNADQFLGASLAWVGDVTGDGLDDFVVAPAPTQGPVQVYSGATGAVLYTLAPGRICAAAGDVDGDGVPDIAIADELSTTGGSQNGYGEVSIWSGATGALVRTIHGNAVGIVGLGTSLDGVGDLDGDGRAEIVVGASQDDPSGVNPRSGSATVFAGATGAPLFSRAGLATEDQLGKVVIGLGDVSGDGIPDLLVGSDMVGSIAANIGGFGEVYALSGVDGSLLWTVSGSQQFESLGAAIAAIGDVDGDGRGDAVVGAPFFTTLFGTGHVLVLSGADGSVIHDIYDPLSVSNHIGTTVSGGGDLDGDHVPDLAVRSVLGFSFPVRIHLFSGATGALIDSIVEPNSWWEEFGFALDLGGDVDGDRLADLLIGSPSADPLGGQMNAGIVSVQAVDPYLDTDADTFSLSAGVPFTLQLAFPSTEAGMPYAVLASRAGHGLTEVSGFYLPLASDPLLLSMIGGASFPGLQQGTGVLSANATATAQVLPMPAFSGLIGQSVSLAAVSVEPAIYTGRTSSIARRVTLIP